MPLRVTSNVTNDASYLTRRRTRIKFKYYHSLIIVQRDTCSGDGTGRQSWADCTGDCTRIHCASCLIGSLNASETCPLYEYASPIQCPHSGCIAARATMPSARGTPSLLPHEPLAANGAATLQRATLRDNESTVRRICRTARRAATERDPGRPVIVVDCPGRKR